MIKEQDIRIGNWFKTNSEDYYRDVGVFKWTFNDWCALGEGYIFLKNIEPIEFTEEMFISLGAKSNDQNDLVLVFDNSCWIIFIKSRKLYYLVGGCGVIDEHGFECKIDYVHEFQNLIWSLTKEEINIELCTR